MVLALPDVLAAVPVSAVDIRKHLAIATYSH